MSLIWLTLAKDVLDIACIVHPKFVLIDVLQAFLDVVFDVVLNVVLDIVLKKGVCIISMIWAEMMHFISQIWPLGCVSEKSSP